MNTVCLIGMLLCFKTAPREAGAINGGMDDALAKVKENDGQVVREKLPVGDMGFAAYFRNSEGNVIGLWQNSSK